MIYYKIGEEYGSSLAWRGVYVINHYVVIHIIIAMQLNTTTLLRIL